MNASLRGSDEKTVRMLDGVAVFWVVFWLVIASVTGYQIWQLSSLSETAEISAAAVDQAGRALQGLSEIPLVGERPGELGTEVRGAAAELDRSAGQTRVDVRRLSILLGLSVFFIPVTPVLGIYLPLRLRRRKEVDSIRAALGSGGREANHALDAFLARRALDTLSYAELQQISPDPVGDLENGRHAALAAAELERLGLAGQRRREAAEQTGG